MTETNKEVNVVDEDEALFEQLIEPRTTGSRTRDENSAFSKFRIYMLRILKVAEKRKVNVTAGTLVNGAVDQGIFNLVSAEQRYRRKLPIQPLLLIVQRNYDFLALSLWRDWHGAALVYCPL